MKRILIEKYSSHRAPSQNKLDDIFDEHDRERAQNSADAAEDLKRHYDNNDAHSKAIAATMNDLRHETKFDEAIALGEERLLAFAGKANDSLQIRDLLAKCYLSKTERATDKTSRYALVDRAISHIEAGLKQAPNDTALLNKLAIAYLQRDETKQAKDVLMDLATTPARKKSNIYTGILSICRKYKLYDIAEIIGEKLIENAQGKENPQKQYNETARGYSIKAWAQLSKGQKAEAAKTIKDMIEYLQKTPDIDEHLVHQEMSIAFHQKAKIAEAQRQFADALKAVNTAIFHRNKLKEVHPEDPNHRDIELLDMKKTALRKLGRHQEAEAVLTVRNNLTAKDGQGTGSP